MDWLNFYTPISQAKVASKVLGQELADEDRDHVRTMVHKLEGTPTVTFINLALGIGW